MQDFPRHEEHRMTANDLKKMTGQRGQFTPRSQDQIYEDELLETFSYDFLSPLQRCLS